MKQSDVFALLWKVVEKKKTALFGADAARRKTLNFSIRQMSKGIEAAQAHMKKLYPLESEEWPESKCKIVKDVKGVGKGICSRIDEIYDTGKLAELDEVKADEEDPKIIAAKKLSNVFGIGPIKAKSFVDAGFLSIDDLMKGHLNGKIKLTDQMLVGIKHYDDFMERIPHDEIIQMEKTIQEIGSKLESMKEPKTNKILYGKVSITICGSYRRKQPTSGDIDVMFTCVDKPTTVVKKAFKEYISMLKEVEFLVDDLSYGETKYLGACKNINLKESDKQKSKVRRIDILAVPWKSYAPAVMYFTGSKKFNIEFRKKALEKGYTVNEYGIYKLVDGVEKKVEEKNRIPVISEKSMFDLVGMDYLEPWER